MSAPGAHQKGPVVSENGFKVGVFGTTTDVISPTGQLYQLGILVSATAAQVNYLAGVTAGTVLASKALVADASKRINELIAGTATDYVQWDPTNKWLKIATAQAGGDAPKAILIDVDVLAGNGFRQGAIQIQIDRAVGQDFTWDGNPDCGIKVIANNRAANVANEGAVRAADFTARNRGTNVSWVNGLNVGARNDSGMTAYQVIGIQTRVENYGTLETEAIGLDVNMSVENDTGSPVKHGIHVRNTDASGMSACTSVVKVSHTSANGFAALLDLDDLTAANGTLLSTSGTAATVWAGRIRIVMPDGTARWINLYSTSNEA